MNDTTEVDRLNAEIADLKRTIEWYQGRTGILMGAKENAVQQAQQWAQEARTQRATVISILNRFGLPENDWEAKRLIVKHVEKLIGAIIPPGPLVADQASEVIAAAQGAPAPTEQAMREKYAQENPPFNGKFDSWQAVAGKYRGENEELRATLAARPAPTEAPKEPNLDGFDFCAIQNAVRNLEYIEAGSYPSKDHDLDGGFVVASIGHAKSLRALYCRV